MKATVNVRTPSTNFRKPVLSTKFQIKRKKVVKRLRKGRVNNANVVLNNTDFEYEEEVCKVDAKNLQPNDIYKENRSHGNKTNK